MTTYTYYLFHTVSNHNVPPVGADTPSRQYVPAIYFNDPIPAGENLFVNQLGAVSYEQPANWEDVWTVYLGGHLYTLTAAEGARLAAAGVTSFLTGPFTSTVAPVFNGGDGSPTGVLVGTGDPGGLVSVGGFGTGSFGVQGFGL